MKDTVNCINDELNQIQKLYKEERKCLDDKCNQQKCAVFFKYKDSIPLGLEIDLYDKNNNSTVKYIIESIKDNGMELIPISINSRTVVGAEKEYLTFQNVSERIGFF